jgi:type IV pilus assembly protein PilA
MTLLGGLKVPTSEALSNNAMAQACSTADAIPGNPAATPPTLDIPAGALHSTNNLVLSGKYVETIVATSTTDTCQLTATFRSVGTSDKLGGKKLRFTYTPANGAWDCSSNITAASIRPKTCSEATIS